MPSLPGSILAAVAVARSNVIVVMDGALICPPEQLPAMAGPVLDGNYDVAIGRPYATSSRIRAARRICGGYLILKTGSQASFTMSMMQIAEFLPFAGSWYRQLPSMGVVRYCLRC